MEHTPGPWTLAPRTRARGDRLDIVTDWTLAGEVTRLHIASVVGAFEPKYSTCANAHLIAAAPELLEALESIMSEYPDMCADAGTCADPNTLGKINRARDAVASAKGETHE